MKEGACMGGMHGRGYVGGVHGGGMCDSGRHA